MGAELDHAGYGSWFRTPLGQVVWEDERRALDRAIGPVSGLRILDAGAGDGRFAVELADAGGRVIGLDRSATMLGAARARDRSGTAKPSWVRGDVGALPFRSGAFDLVVAVTVLCFAPEPAHVARELARVVRPGGRVVIGELGRWSTWTVARRLRGWRDDDLWKKARFWSRRDLRRLLADAGLRPERESAAVFYPRNRYLSRLIRPAEAWLGQTTTLGAAFLVAVGRRQIPAPRK